MNYIISSKRLYLLSIALTSVIILLSVKSDMFGNVRFRSYSDDRDRLERYIDRARNAADIERWDRIIQSGKESLEVEWERDADLKIKEALREDEGCRLVLEREKQEALAEWEREVGARIDKEAGAWYARRQGIIYEGFDVARFREVLIGTEGIEGGSPDERIAEWDSIVNPAMDEIRVAWEGRLDNVIDELRFKVGDLDGVRREFFDREVYEIEEELHSRFHLERNSFVYRERNLFISDLILDSDSLRRMSEKGSADAVTDRILQETLEDLRSEEERILKRETEDPEDFGELDLSNLGDNWEEEVRSLIERGLKRWSAAQDRLFSAMSEWRADAGDALERGERMWQESYERLLDVRDKWWEGIEREINEGLLDWQEREDELASNIERSRIDLMNYLAVQNEQWQVSSEGLHEMAIYGMNASEQAEENVKWLKNEMVPKYQNIGYYNSGVIFSFNQHWASINANVKPAALNIARNNERAYTLLQIMDSYEGLYGYYKIWSNPLFDGARWKGPFYRPNRYYDRIIIRDFTLTPTSVNDFNTDNKTVIENYTIYLTMGYMYWDDKPGSDDVSNDVMSINFNNYITADTPDSQKSRYYYYVTENDNWNETLIDLESIINEVEFNIHNRTMLGEEGGAGYLVNTDGLFGLKYQPNSELEFDPYLMTSAEFNYEYARRELQFWERRLGIAEAVMMYAYLDEYDGNEFAPGGKRESAEITIKRKEEAESLLKEARALYSQSLEGIGGIVSRLQDYKSSIANLTSQLSALESALDVARSAYEAIKLQVMENENLEGASDDILNSLREAGDECKQLQAEYNGIRDELEQARREYENTNKEYSALMNMAAENYARYSEVEYEYERAYAVWEYANNPYLKDTATHDSGLGSGFVHGSDEAADYGDVQVPDARENYEYILSIYNNVHEVFLIEANALEDQESVEMLAINTEYMSLREDLEEAIVAYINNPTEENRNSRMAVLAAYRNYCSNSVALGVHDSTVILRDQESLFWELLQYAKNADSPEGYNLIVSELLSNGSGTSVDDMIVGSLIQQNRSFQEQVWDHQRMQFEQRRDRWIEVIGFIMNRGERDWNSNINSFVNRWRRWRIEARDEISKGEEEWESIMGDFNRNMFSWQRDASEESSMEGSKMMAAELSERIELYLDGINRNLPGGVRIEVDTNSILNGALAQLHSGIGILSGTMNTVDTAAGFAQMINLDLSGGLYRDFESRMAEFHEKMEVMQAVRMAESAYGVFTEILKSFNEQLANANESVYDQVKTGIRDKYRKAPFKRGEGTWSIRYISDHSLAKTKRKTYQFEDYRNYINTTVLLKPLKNIGGEIDFHNPYTYQDLNRNNLELYINLEQQHLNREIEAIFGDGGCFSKHTSDEFERLGRGFAEGYHKYIVGKAKKKGKWYNTPVVSNAPSPRVLAQVAGSISLTAAGCPWAAFALNSAFTGMDVAQGDLYWQHAALQTGVSFASSYVGGLGTGMLYKAASQSINIAASGIEYGEDGDIGWSNEILKEGIKDGVVSMALSGAFSATNLNQGCWGAGLTASTRGFIMSGLETDGKWYEFDFDDEYIAEHITVGMASGITATTMHLIGEAAGWNKIQHDAEGRPITGVRDPFEPNVFMHGYAERALSGLLDSSLMTLGYNLRDGGRFKNDYSEINWNSMIYNHQDLAGTLGLKAAYETNKYLRRYDSRSAEGRNRTRSDPLNKADDFLAGIHLSLRRGAEDVEEIYEAVTQDVKDVFESSVNLLMHGEFISDKDIAVAAAIDEMKGVYGKYHKMVDMQQSQDIWNAGLMDVMVGINRGQIKEVNYSFTGDGGVALYASSNQPLQTAIKHFSIYDLNAASTFGKTGGYKDANLNKNMKELTNKLGTSAKEIQDLYDAGLLTDSVANAIASTAVEGMSNTELSRFIKSYDIAAGLSSGYIEQENGGYYNNAGQRVAGMWGDLGIVNNNTIYLSQNDIASTIYLTNGSVLYNDSNNKENNTWGITPENLKQQINNSLQIEPEWYFDLNFSLGAYIGLTGGIIIDDEGIYPYVGGGFITSPGISLTWSPARPALGVNVGLQGGYYFGGNVGSSINKRIDWFVELGISTPGASFTGYYIFKPWKWNRENK